MSKRSARKKGTHHNTQRSTRNPQPVVKRRGGWLTAILIFIIIHGVFTAALILSYHKAQIPLPTPWLWAAALAVGLTDIVAAVALWFWKKWGLYLYIVATFAGIALGLVVLPSLLTAFHGIIPLGLLALVLSWQRKMAYLQ